MDRVLTMFQIPFVMNESRRNIFEQKQVYFKEISTSWWQTLNLKKGMASPLGTLHKRRY
jgi:hypothetical protein